MNGDIVRLIASNVLLILKMMKKEINLCFICKKDITDSTKVISYYNYPNAIWDDLQKDWVKNFRKLFNGAMCSDCAKKDLDIIHKRAMKQSYETDKNKILEHLIYEMEHKIGYKILKFFRLL